MAENESEKNASASSRRASSWGQDSQASSLPLFRKLPGTVNRDHPLVRQLPAARVCCQGQPITRNCLWGQVSVSKGNPTLLLFNFRLVVGPRQPPIPLPPTCSFFPQPYASVPTTVRTVPHPQRRPCGEWRPPPQGRSPTTARARRLVPCPWGPARNLSELKQDLGARLSDDGVRDAEATRSHPSLSSDSSGHSISSESQWLPGVSCSGATTALSLAKEVIKQLSLSYCLWVSLLS